MFYSIELTSAHYILAGAAAVVWPLCRPYPETQPRPWRLTPTRCLSWACTTVWTLNLLCVGKKLFLGIYLDNLRAGLEAFHQSAVYAWVTVIGLMIGMGVRFVTSRDLALKISTRLAISAPQRH